METVKLSFDTMHLSSRHFVEELLYLGIRDRALLNLQSACRHRYKLLEFEWKTFSVAGNESHENITNAALSSKLHLITRHKCAITIYVRMIYYLDSQSLRSSQSGRYQTLIFEKYSKLKKNIEKRNWHK